MPGGLTIVGFGNFEFAGEHGLALTTVRIPGHLIGAEAGRMIIRRKQGDADMPKSVDVGFEIVRAGARERYSLPYGGSGKARNRNAPRERPHRFAIHKKDQSDIASNPCVACSLTVNARLPEFGAAPGTFA